MTLTFLPALLVTVLDWRQKRAGTAAVETRARELGCCKLTLEVLDQNHRALRTYLAAGFQRYTLQPGAGEAIFLSKPLS